MAETTLISLLGRRHQAAVDAVRIELEGDTAFQRISEKEGGAFSSCSAIWRTHIHLLDQDWSVDVGLPKYFPDEAPISRVLEWEPLMLRSPHVLEGGILCTIPLSAALDSSDPVGLVKYVLAQSENILKETSTDDFREEFSYYWARSINKGSTDVLVIDPIEQLGKTFPASFREGFVCVASSIERLNRWVSNCVGNAFEEKSGDFGIAIPLNEPLLPIDYPDTLEDLVSLADKIDVSVGQLIREHIVKSHKKGLVLLVQKEGDGVALGGVIFVGLGLFEASSAEIIKGFRKGKAPSNILLSRASQLIQSSKISRTKVIRVDHKWIHSRGGDGRDLFKKSVLIIGCGSLGGYVAHLLSRAGVGRITITDNDHLGCENLGRHILGASSIGQSKAKALAEKLKQELPHLEITGIPQDWRDIFESNQKLFSDHDLVISTVADWRCEGPLNSLTRKAQMPPVLFGWLEPHAVAGHCLLISKNGGCFGCSVNRFGQFDHSVANFHAATISKEPGGCTHYQHYGPTALMPVVSMIASVVVESLLKPPDKSFLTTWVSSSDHFKSVSACISDHWAQDIANNGYSRIYSKSWDSSTSCHLCTPIIP